MKRWYVAQIYAGYEEAIKTDLLRRVQEEGLSDFFGEVLIPTAKLKQMFESAESPKNEHQLFPGYLLIEMEPVQEAIRLVTTTPRIIRLLGALAQKEIERIMSQMKGEVAVAAKKSDFVIGSEVEIAEGPFAGFVGIIDKVEEENEKLVVMVSIFGRITPVELGFDQVKH